MASPRRWTKDQIKKELIRCGSDPKHFIRNYCKIATEKGGIVDFKLYPFQEDLLDSFRDNKDNIILKARQLGISTVTSAYVAWLGIFRKARNIVIVATKEKTAINLLRKVKLIFDHLPPWISQMASVTKNNTTTLELSNRSKIEAAPLTEDVGRSESLSLLVIDEAASIPKMDEVWTSLKPTISTGGKIVALSCVTKDTYVITDVGVRQIADFVSDEEEQKSYEITPYMVAGRDKLREGCLFHNNGKVQTKKIKTSFTELEGSLNHKLWIKRDGQCNWFKLEDLQEGDCVSVHYGQNNWGTNDQVDFKSSNGTFIQPRVTEDLGFFLGLCLSQGDVEKARILNDSIRVIISLEDSIEFVEYMGFDLKTQEIPKRMFDCSSNIIASFLAGLFFINGHKYKNGNIVYSAADEKQGKQVRALLLNFGILAHKISYLGRAGLELSEEHVGIFNEKIGFRNGVVNSFDLKNWSKSTKTTEKQIWLPIQEIIESENYTYDFSLPETDDFWCHSVVYNGILGHQTPKGRGNWFHKSWHKAEIGESSFFPTKLMWWEHPDYDQKWFDHMTLDMNDKQIAQELMCDFGGSGDGVFQARDLQRIKEEDLAKCLHKECLDQNLWIWEFFEPGKPYLLAADVSRGDGKDYSSFVIMESETMTQAAEYYGKVEYEEFAKIINMAGHQYGSCMVVVENAQLGIAVVKELKELKYPKIYHSVKGTHKYISEAEAEFRPNTIGGFTTSLKTRPLILAKFEEYVRRKVITIRSQRLHFEMENFLWITHKAQARKEYNDDLIMATAIACWVRDTVLIESSRAKDLDRACLKGIFVQRRELDTRIDDMHSHRDRLQRKRQEAQELVKKYPALFRG